MRKIVFGTLKKEILVLAYKDCFKLYDTSKYISDDGDRHNNKDACLVRPLFLLRVEIASVKSLNYESSRCNLQFHVLYKVFHGKINSIPLDEPC